MIVKERGEKKKDETAWVGVVWYGEAWYSPRKHKEMEGGKSQDWCIVSSMRIRGQCFDAGRELLQPSKHFYNSSSKSYRVIFLTYNPSFYVRSLQTPRTIILQLVADLGLQLCRQNGSRLHHLSTHMEIRETPSALDVSVHFFFLKRVW